MTTGRSRVRSSARMRCSTSIPLTFGSLRSSNTTAGRSCSAGPLPSVPKRMSSACAPSCATTTSLVMLSLLSARIVRAASSGLSSTSRIFPGFTRASRPAGGPLQSEVERRSLIDGALGPDPAAVPGDDAHDGGEPDARALELGRGVQALEHAEQLVRVLHVEAGAVVPDHEGPAAVDVDGAEFDARLRLLGGVLPAVAEEILEDNPQQTGVSLRLEPRGDREFHLPFWGGVLQLGYDVLRDAAQVHRLAAHLRAGDPRELEQVVDQHPHSLRGRAHPLQGISPRVVQPLRVVLQHHLAEAIDAAKRGAQVVRHGVGERVELPVSGEELRRIALHCLVALLELVGAFLDPLLELRGIALELFLACSQGAG